MDVSPDLRISFPPLGMMPSWDVIDRNTTSSMLGFKDHYAMNKWLLMGEGDILLLHTDGIERARARRRGVLPVAARIRGARRPSGGRPATSTRRSPPTCVAFSPPADDISLVVIKRR